MVREIVYIRRRTAMGCYSIRHFYMCRDYYLAFSCSNEWLNVIYHIYHILPNPVFSLKSKKRLAHFCHYHSHGAVTYHPIRLFIKSVSQVRFMA
jgi:hypothetical protein